MAEFAGNYQDLINDILRRTEESRKAAEARGIGEAQRRGFVNPTGTSDVEMSLRRAQTEPIVQGGQSDVAKILANIAEQQEARKYQTSERIGSQGWQTGEREASQGFQGRMAGFIDPRTGQWVSSQAGEAAKQRGWQTGEREAGQTWEGKMAGYIDPNTGAWTPTYGSGANAQYGARGQASEDFIRQVEMNKQNQPKKKKWYQTGASALAGVGGQVLGSWMSPGGWWGNKAGGG